MKIKLFESGTIGETFIGDSISDKGSAPDSYWVRITFDDGTQKQFSWGYFDPVPAELKLIQFLYGRANSEIFR